VALIGNASLLHKSPARYSTGTVGFCDRANWNKPGSMRNRGDLSLSTLWKYDAVPSGTYAGRAFFPPQKAGRLVARGSFFVDSSAVGAAGKPGQAAATFAVNAGAVGGLFAGGVAICTMTFSASGSISGRAAGSADATISVSAFAAPSGLAMGSAAAPFSVTASASGRGLGYMQASTVDNSIVTPASITQAVWSALSADYVDAGTMGAKLNAAGSGGVDFNALAAAVWGYMIEPGFQASREIKIIAAAVAGKTSGGPASFVARNLSDTADQLTGTAATDGNRGTAVYGA
jgi:hypothetical protein